MNEIKGTICINWNTYTLVLSSICESHTNVVNGTFQQFMHHTSPQSLVIFINRRPKESRVASDIYVTVTYFVYTETVNDQN